MAFDMRNINSALGGVVDNVGSQISTEVAANQNGEMSEVQMLQLQHSLNRWSIMINMQSNIMKTWSEALKSVVSNMR